MFNINCLYQGIVRGSRYHLYRCGHVNHFTISRLSAVLKKAGFKVERGVGSQRADPVRGRGSGRVKTLELVSCGISGPPEVEGLLERPQRGIEAAWGSYVTMGDSDDSYDFRDVGPPWTE